ncbi:MAG TPA: CpsD/CapB family tyrosine-protein kinase [Vicinamibacterales bacterium]|nr:CpsD/CapB family tyrosine-protein kinase [Vicinamibacterales bacterium]
MAPAEQLVSLVAPSSIEADQYRGLRHNVERMRREAGVQLLAVTSAGAGEGKSVTTLNLAGSLAQSRETRVLVIDADLHRPSVAEYLGIEPPQAPGLADLIRDQDVSLATAVRRLDGPNLSVLPSGTCETGAYELLNSPRLEGVLLDARRSFDFVLIDTPPVLPLPDCRLISQWVDGLMVVVSAHRTPRRALAEALTLLDPAKVIGLVFNGDDRPLTGYSSYNRHYYSSPPSGPREGRSWRRPGRPAAGDHRARIARR